jgi:hypothetical protein
MAMMCSCLRYLPEIINPKYTISKVLRQHILASRQPSNRKHRNILGLFANGIQAVRIVNPPFSSPEVPRPATARPTISILLETAMPHRKEPSSKTAKKTRNVYYRASQRNQRWHLRACPPG